MTDVRGDSGSIAPTLFSAFFFLFFIQLLTIWMESIYRLSLIKLSPGKELLGLLFVLSPLVALVAGKTAQRPLLVASLFVMFLARALCPLFEGAGLMVVAGAGLGAALVALCCLPLDGSRISPGNLGRGLAIAVLASVALRAWGSSFDLSMGQQGNVLAWALVACAVFLCRGSLRRSEEDPPAHPATLAGRLAGSILLLSSLALVYLVLSSPAVVTAWSGSNYTLAIIFISLSFGLIVDWRGPSQGMLLIWNVAFVAAVLAGILLHTVDFPDSPTAPALVVEPASWPSHIPFYLVFLLSPVVVFNAIAAFKQMDGASPRSQALPVVAGMVFITTLTLVLIFTNIWGYMGPVIHALRNKFYLPFLLLGAGMIVPWLLPVWKASFPLREDKRRSLLPAVVALAVGVFAVAGAIYGGAGLPQPPGNPETLTVLTYNMQQGTDIDGNRNLHDQLELIRTIDADIIGLQESDTARPSLGNIDSARFFAERLGYYVYYGPNTISGTFGTAILSRYPLENPRTFFTYSTIDEVGTAVAEIEVGGRRIGLFNSHPAGPRDVMVAHAEALVRECAQYEHVITMGDHNARPGSPAYEIVAEALSNTWIEKYPEGTGPPHPSWPESTPENRDYDVSTRRIDHIFASPDFEVLESYYVLSPDSETDHPAHWSVLRLPQQP